MPQTCDMVQEFLAPLGSTGELRIPQRGDLAQKFREGVERKGPRGIFGWVIGSDDAGRLTGRAALIIKLIAA